MANEMVDDGSIGYFKLPIFPVPNNIQDEIDEVFSHLL
jgi:hypothetical protein